MNQRTVVGEDTMKCPLPGRVCLSSIPAVGRLRQEDCHESEVSLEYIHQGYKARKESPFRTGNKVSLVRPALSISEWL